MPRASVVVPAHNEEGRVGTTLRALLNDAEPGEFDVIVVCNGCSDGTADEARAVEGVRVLGLAEGSKIGALRVGDAATDVFPRIYLDADVEMRTSGLRALVAALDQPRPLAASMVGHYLLDQAPLGVRLYMEFRARLPVFADGFIGAGVYAMNRAGRARFGEWPEVLGDDQLVFRLFAPAERVTVPGHRTVIEPPNDLREVVRRGVRVRQGNAELTHGGSEMEGIAAPPAGFRTALLGSLRSVRGVASAVVFVATNLTVRILATTGRGGDWATRRDD